MSLRLLFIIYLYIFSIFFFHFLIIYIFSFLYIYILKVTLDYCWFYSLTFLIKAMTPWGLLSWTLARPQTCLWRSQRRTWAPWPRVSEPHLAMRSPACWRDCQTATSVSHSSSLPATTCVMTELIKQPVKKPDHIKFRQDMLKGHQPWFASIFSGKDIIL